MCKMCLFLQCVDMTRFVCVDSISKILILFVCVYYMHACVYVYIDKRTLWLYIQHTSAVYQIHTTDYTHIDYCIF